MAAKPMPDDQVQSKRFIEAAREIECDESLERFAAVKRNAASPGARRRKAEPELIDVNVSRMEYEARLREQFGQFTIEKPEDYWVPMTPKALKQRVKKLGFEPNVCKAFTRRIKGS